MGRSKRGLTLAYSGPHAYKRAMITVPQALSHIAACRPISESETVPLAQARGRVLASAIAAKLTQPPLAASAMDGYAVRLCDVGTQAGTQGGAKLVVIGEAPAGRPFAGTVGAGQAVRIFTGGAMPNGADSVVIQENVTRNGEHITINEPQQTARHVRQAGVDFHAGDILITAGTRIGPAQIAVAAAANHAKILVQKRFTVAILSGGDELVALGSTPKIGQIINSNPHALAALIEEWGHEALILPCVSDSVESITRQIKGAAKADIIVPVGGASVGDHDYMRPAFTKAGLKMIFEKIAVRPGKPTWLGSLSGKPVLGLPGNPASALVCAHVFLRPLLSGNPTVFQTAQLGCDIPANGSREHYQRARVETTDNGTLRVTPMPRQDSSLLTPFLSANALLRREVDSPAQAKGGAVQILMTKPL